MFSSSKMVYYNAIVTLLGFSIGHLILFIEMIFVSIKYSIDISGLIVRFILFLSFSILFAVYSLKIFNVQICKSKIIYGNIYNKDRTYNIREIKAVKVWCHFCYLHKVIFNNGLCIYYFSYHKLRITDRH